MNNNNNEREENQIQPPSIPPLPLLLKIPTSNTNSVNNNNNNNNYYLQRQQPMIDPNYYHAMYQTMMYPNYYASMCQHRPIYQGPQQQYNMNVPRLPMMYPPINLPRLPVLQNNNIKNIDKPMQFQWNSFPKCNTSTKNINKFNTNQWLFKNLNNNDPNCRTYIPSYPAQINIDDQMLQSLKNYSLTLQNKQQSTCHHFSKYIIYIGILYA